MITPGKIKLAKQSKIRILTKVEMSISKTSMNEAYRILIKTDLYRLLNNTDTDIYLEDIEYVIKAYRLERESSKEAMYEFIRYV